MSWALAGWGGLFPPPASLLPPPSDCVTSGGERAGGEVVTSRKDDPPPRGEIRGQPTLPPPPPPSPPPPQFYLQLDDDCDDDNDRMGPPELWNRYVIWFSRGKGRWRHEAPTRQIQPTLLDDLLVIYFALSLSLSLSLSLCVCVCVWFVVLLYRVKASNLCNLDRDIGREWAGGGGRERERVVTSRGADYGSWKIHISRRWCNLNIYKKWPTSCGAPVSNIKIPRNQLQKKKQKRNEINRNFDY